MAFDKVKQAKQLNDFRKQAQAIQKELKDTLIEATEADGQIRVVFTGEQKIEEIYIDEAFLQPERKRDLERYLKATIAQGIAESQKVAAGKMQAIAGGLGLPGL